MKKLILASALLLTSIFGRAEACLFQSVQKSPDGFVINGTLKGNAENARVSLISGVSNTTGEPVYVAQALVKNGKFQLKGRLEGPKSCQLYILLADTTLADEDRNLEHYFYVENAVITFDADVATMASAYYYSDKRQVIPVVTGSVTEALSNELKSRLKDVTAKRDVLLDKLGNEYYIPSKEGKDVTATGIKYQRELEPLEKQREAIIIEFIKKHAASIVAVDKAREITTFESKTLDQYNEILSALEPAWAGKPDFEEFKKRINTKKNMAIGVKIPDAEFLTETGEKASLYSLLPKDGYALVEFWASWCGPCRDEISHLKKVKEKYPELSMLSLSIDEKDADWKRALQEEGMTWTQLNYPPSLGDKMETQYGIGGIPAGFVVDKEGKIIATDMRGPALDKLLLELYGR